MASTSAVLFLTAGAVYFVLMTNVPWVLPAGMVIWAGRLAINGDCPPTSVAGEPPSGVAGSAGRDVKLTVVGTFTADTNVTVAVVWLPFVPFGTSDGLSVTLCTMPATTDGSTVT